MRIAPLASPTAVVAAAVLRGRIEQITCRPAARDGGSYNALLTKVDELALPE